MSQRSVFDSRERLLRQAHELIGDRIDERPEDPGWNAEYLEDQLARAAWEYVCALREAWRPRGPGDIGTYIWPEERARLVEAACGPRGTVGPVGMTAEQLAGLEAHSPGADSLEPIGERIWSGA